MTVIYYLPAWIVLLLTICGLTSLACAGHVAVRKAFAHYDFRIHNEVAGFVYAVVGVVFAVLLGFVVIVVWQQYNDSEERDRGEVAAVAFAVQLCAGLPENVGSGLRARLRAYVDDVIDSEWPAMQHGGASPAAQATLDTAVKMALAIAPSDPRSAHLAPLLISRLNVISDARRHRLDDNVTGLPWLLWTALWIGAIVVIGFGYLFGMPNFRVQLVMTASVTIVTGTLFVVIAELDYPFRGDIGIKPNRWVALRSTLPRYAAVPAGALRPIRALLHHDGNGR